MRHLGSVVLSLVLAPAICFLLVYGTRESRLATAALASGGGTQWRVDLAAGCALIVGAGLLYSLLALTRLSPAGPLPTGLLLAAAGVWVMLDPRWFAGHDDALPLGVDANDLTAAAPTALVLAVPLLLTVFNRRRWRRADRPAGTAASTDPAPGYSAPPAPVYPSPVFPPLTAAEREPEPTTLTLPSQAPPPGPAPIFDDPESTQRF